MSSQIPQEILDELLIDPDIPVVLPKYLLADMEAYEEGRRTDSSVVDCLADELSASLHMAVEEHCLTDTEERFIREYYKL
jgi:hypothetical protein